MQTIIYQNKIIAIVSNLIACLLSILVLYAWHFDSISIIGIFPKHQLSNPVTALCFLLASVSIITQISHNRKIQNAGKLLALVLIIIALVRIGDLVFDFTSYVDRWLYPSKLSLYGNNGKPNYMAPNTAINFVLLGSSLLFLSFKVSYKNVLADYLALACLLLSFISISGYLYDSLEMYSVKSSIPMAFPTAISFFLLSSAVLFQRSGFGLFSVFTRKYVGSTMARNLIPFAIILPILSGALRIYGQKLGLYSISLGVSINSAVDVIVFVILLWKSAVSLNKSQKALLCEIEERESAQAETKSNQLFLDTVLEHIPDLAFIKRADDFSFVRVNRAFEEIFGYRREDIVGKSNFDLFSKSDAEYMFITDKETLLKDGLAYYPEINVPFAGNDRWFNIKKVVITHPTTGQIFILGIGQEITEQKLLNDEIMAFNMHLEEMIEERTNELYRNEKLFRSMIENSVDIISIADADNLIKYVSPAIEKVLGIKPNDILGKKNLSFIHAESLFVATKVRADVRNNPGVPFSTRLKILHKDGHPVWVEGTVTNLLHDENVKGIVCNLHDVTERIEAENKNRILEEAMHQEQINMQKQLIQASIEGQEKEKKQMGMELHDNINQILASTKMYLEIGKNDASLTSKMLHKGADQINYAIQEIRKLSKSLVPHGIEEGDIRDVVMEITNAISLSAGIEFSIKISDAALNKLDSKQQTTIFRIIQEQLNNIVKHAQAKAVMISLDVNNGLFKLVISDNGKGFKVDQKKSGIGLSNIKTRSQLLNGQLSLESAEGKGCTLKIAFGNCNTEAA